MTEPQESHNSWSDEQKWSFLLRHERLGELLVRHGKLTLGQLEAALREQVKSRNTKHFGEIVVEMRLLSLDEMVAVLDKQNQIQQTSEQAIRELKSKSKE
jgi:hypothetical protein